VSRPRKPRLSDIARECGTSLATVSRALSQPSLVQPETLERIRAAARRLGYVPNRKARALVSGQSSTIGVVVPTLNSAIFSVALQEMQRAFSANGYQLLVASHEYDSAAEAAALLGGTVPGAAAGVAGSGGRPGVFLVPGQGTTAAGTGLALYRDEPAFRAAADALAPVLAAELGVGVAALLAGGAVPPARTDHAQAALFVVGWGLAALWRSWGVRPAALAGHSVGEYVAACLAGVFDPAAALRLVCRRGRLMAAQPAGAIQERRRSNG